MDIRIGVTQSVKELELELDDTARAQVQADIAAALAAEAGMLWLTDKKGRTVGIPAAKIGYIEIGGPTEERKVGFAR